MSIRIFPTFPDPVNPIAVISGWLAIQCVISGFVPSTKAKMSGESPTFLSPATTAACIARQVFGCEGCALTTTGQPAARADALSPPITENANGKLLAAKIPATPKA